MSDVGLVAQLVAVGDTHPRCGLSYRLPIFQNLYFIVTEEPLSSPTFGVLIRPLCCVSLTHGRGRLHLATYTYTPCIQTIVKNRISTCKHTSIYKHTSLHRGKTQNSSSSLATGRRGAAEQ